MGLVPALPGKAEAEKKGEELRNLGFRFLHRAGRRGAIFGIFSGERNGNVSRAQGQGVPLSVIGPRPGTIRSLPCRPGGQATEGRRDRGGGRRPKERRAGLQVSAFIVGLTGGIGSGKNAVAELFVEQGGLVDTDAIAHELTGPGGETMPALVAAFGAQARADGGWTVPRCATWFCRRTHRPRRSWRHPASRWPASWRPGVASRHQRHT